MARTRKPKPPKYKTEKQVRSFKSVGAAKRFMNAEKKKLRTWRAFEGLIEPSDGQVKATVKVQRLKHEEDFKQ